MSEQGPAPSRKELKRARAQARTAQGTESRGATRRSWLKMVTPGGWIPEIAQRKGLTKLSTPAKISLAKDIALSTGGVGLAAFEHSYIPTLTKERLQQFSWEDAKDPEKLNQLLDQLVDKYLESTQTPRLKKEQLTIGRQIHIFQNRLSYLVAVAQVSPQYNQRGPEQWGYADYGIREIFFDLETMKQLNLHAGSDKTAGLALIDALWHELGHLDVEERKTGELINNPSAAAFISPFSGQLEPYRRYRGGEVFTDTYYGFLRFDEVWNEVNTTARIRDTFGFGSKDDLVSARDYYLNGVDIFPAIARKLNIPLSTFYNMHATSDFEGLAKLIGQSLPGNESPLRKGIRLFRAIHDASLEELQQTGVLSLIK